MKIEQLAPDKVRVTLSSQDLMDMDIDPKHFLSDATALNGFIIELMNEIYDKTDFNPYQGNITMEAESDPDGMTIMLSKANIDLPLLAAKGHIKGVIGVPKSKLTKTDYKKKKIKSVKAVKKPVSLHTFEFSDFDNVCKALIRMNTEIISISELYRTNDGYALLIPTKESCLDDIAMVMEFADTVKRSMVFEHIREHCECVAKCEKLLSMAEGIKMLDT